VPAIDPAAAPGGAVTPQPASTASDTGVIAQGAPSVGGGQATKVVSRYSGDVLLQAEAPPFSPEGAAPAAIAPQAPGSDLAGQGGGGGLMQTASSQQQPQVSGAVLSHQGNVGPLLTATVIPKVTASKIGDRNLLLAKGAQIDCALTTKLVNEVSGFASCVLTSNVYSDNGRVLLLERGSEALGEYAAAIQQGQRRLFVLWQRVKTPTGIVINLDSPAADGLGTMGLDGYVDNRWWDRLGAAFLLSFVQDGIAYEVAKATNNSSSPAGGFAYQNTAQTGSQMADRVLASTINIRPTIYKNQGDRASLYVARDLDFSTVYALRAN
jgi:type IV secretion system protein VirB10